ncbi:NAD(P)-dependent oxidoreductase [Ascidiaceihabitans sp.]|uniref:NAD(P)-dependent oxidoreductase n=1 Tax=Ascidiaceihabitans sp. TaxID=1872644 RepID=UPI003297F258
MAQKRNIALIGTGLMGVPMSLNLMVAGHDLTVWNRTQSRAAPVVENGAHWAESAALAIAKADVLITMLSDGFAALALLEDAEFLAQLTPGKIWLDMSSTKPEHARTLSSRLSPMGVAFMDAPVSGGTKGAQAATLAIMAGGSADTFDVLRPVFDAMGRAVHVGPVGSGQLAKLANQTIVAVTISAVAEAILLIEQGGADPAAVRDALKGGFADSIILQQHGARMSAGDFAPGGLSKFQRKDLDNTLAEAATLGLELPSTQAVRDRFDHFIEHMGGADLDHSGLYLELKARNGMPS